MIERIETTAVSGMARLPIGCCHWIENTRSLSRRRTILRHAPQACERLASPSWRCRREEKVCDLGRERPVPPFQHDGHEFGVVNDGVFFLLLGGRAAHKVTSCRDVSPRKRKISAKLAFGS